MCCKRLWKGVCCTLLFLLMLTSLVFNKASLIWLLGGTKINNVPMETWYAAFALVFLVPELFAVIKVLWNTSFIKQTSTHQWPSGVALLVGFLVSFAEVSSYLMFTLEIAPRLPIQLLMPLLSSVFAVALCYQQWESYMIKRAKDQEVHFDGNFTLAHKAAETVPDDANWKRLVKTLFGMSGVWATCAIAAVSVLTNMMPWFQALCLPTSLSLLSLAWSPKVQMYTVRSPDGTFQGRWKAMCLYTVFKIIVLTVGISIIMVIRLQQHHILDSNFFVKLSDGLYGCLQKEILYPLLIHFGSSLGGHLTGFAAATLCVPNIGMTLPSMLATPVAIAIGMYFCIPSFQLLDELTCYSSNISIWCMFALALIAWIAPYLILGNNLTKQCEVLLKPMDELFIQVSWNGMFLDQHMFLNYTHEGFTPCKEHVASNTENVSRVFICTTMYREADWEMKRLLTSLYNISQSKKIKDVYLEAHVFLDNGTKDLHLTDFAIQLVSLLESTMSIRPSQANCLQTPYGVQLNWLLPGVTKMPFFIHLKDCSIIKAKKRWSQVMYMSYVLNFRVLRDSSKEKSQVKNKVKEGDDSLFVGYSSDKEWKKNATTLSSREIKRESLPIVPERSTTVEETEEQCHNVNENKKYLGRLFNTDPDNRNVTGIQQGIAITSLLESYSRNDSITNPSSSDQGIGTSQDDASVSSFTTNSPQGESPGDTLASRGTSASQSDSYWRDYEGDISSCNENSLTSSKARQSRTFLTEADMHGELPNINPDESLGKCSILRFNPTKNIARGLNRPPAPPIPHRPLPPKPPRSKKATKDAKNNKKKQELKASPSTQQLIDDMNDSQTNIYQSIRSTAMESELKAAPRNRKNKGKDDEIFTIARETIPKDSDLNETRAKIPLDDNTYILATDADMEFTDDSILDLLHLCNHDRRLGGACGRTHPIGQNTGPVVWYQKFEYAKDFWMIKSSQNIVGSVMCCPGCFSLYRASAIRDIISNYAGPTDQSFDVFIKDTGEDRWMCTLMMLNGWKLEYSAFCHNTTYCPDTFTEFMKQRRRWVLSDLANMLLVFKNIFKLAKKNDSFSVAYILYLIQMFTIVLFAPASTIVIIAGGFDIIYGIPFQIVAPGLGMMILLYSLLCIVGNMKVQARATLLLTMMAGLCMVLVVIGGAVYIAEDIYQNIIDGNVRFQEYYLILFLIGSLLFAALLHPCETWILAHGFAYLLGFPAMQIFLPIYAICNIVDQSWGTRENNKPKTRPAVCCGRSREKFQKNIKKEDLPKDPDADATSSTVDVEEEATVVCTDTNFRLMKDGSSSEYEEYLFWEKMREIVLGTSVNLSVCGKTLKKGLAHLRNICLGSLLVLNSLWLMLLSVLYFNADLNLVKLNVYGLIAGTVYGLVLLVQVVGLISHRFEAVFARYALKIFGGTLPVWVFRRTA